MHETITPRVLSFESRRQSARQQKRGASGTGAIRNGLDGDGWLVGLIKRKIIINYDIIQSN